MLVSDTDTDFSSEVCQLLDSQTRLSLVRALLEKLRKKHACFFMRDGLAVRDDLAVRDAWSSFND